MEADALDEETHQILMLAYARAGNRTRALRQYEACRQALADDLNAAPSPETDNLRRLILSGEIDAQSTKATLVQALLSRNRL